MLTSVLSLKGCRGVALGVLLFPRLPPKVAEDSELYMISKINVV